MLRILSVLILTVFVLCIHQNDYWPSKKKIDFVVIGAGSSGAVVANRLSENSSWNVLLLEAGGFENFFTKIPLLAAALQLTPYNWKYTVESQNTSCLGMKKQKCAWPRGKALGGSSVINYMMYVRGNPKDYDIWAGAGNKGWSYKEVLPYFKKSERCNLGKNICSSSYHGVNGSLSVEWPFKTRLVDTFIEAGVEMGEAMVDYNTPDYMGFSQVQGNVRFGRRHSIADAFLTPIIDTRKNLKIITSAKVTKIIIDPMTKTATGVKFQYRGQTYNVDATKEVILSAGVLNSPQLLMLSGVGPKDHLNELNIPVIKNLPVGRKIYDHITYAGLAYTINQTVLPRSSIVSPIGALKWFSTGQGPLADVGGVEALGFINTGSIPDPKYPDIELIYGSISLSIDFGLTIANAIRIRRNVYDTFFKPLELKQCFTILPILLHPKSHGYLKLKSSNPNDPPLLYANYLSDPKGIDIKTLLAAVRYVQKMTQTKAFQKFDAKLNNISLPGCESFVYDSDDYWFCALRTLTTTIYHQSGSCKMGPSTDTEAVVDDRLKVHGVKSLRVIDSSVIPVTISGHLHAPSVMIGEKGSDLIKKEWGML